MPGVIAVQDLAPRAHRQRSENVSRGVKLQWCGDALESQILLLEDGAWHAELTLHGRLEPGRRPPRTGSLRN